MSAKKKPAKRRRKSTAKPRSLKTVQRERKEAMESVNEVLEQMPFADVAFTPKEARFIEEYPIDLNGAAAARRAGYSEATAKAIACELLAKPHIQDAITKELEARSARTRVDADRVIGGIAELAFYDIADLFDEKGALHSIHELSPMLRRAIAGIEVTELFADVGGQRVHVGHLKKVKLADRKGNLELLGRHLALFTDKHQHDVGPTLEEILTKSREGK